MKAHISRCWSTNLYYATLLGGEFDNCYGQGETADSAMISLRIVVNMRRRKQNKKNT